MRTFSKFHKIHHKISESKNQIVNLKMIKPQKIIANNAIFAHPTNAVEVPVLYIDT